MSCITRLVPWKKITILPHRSVCEARTELLRDACRITLQASEILDATRLPLEGQSYAVNLGKITVGELGFKYGAPMSKIRSAGRERGGEKCSLFDGPYFRIDYKEQPVGEQVILAMETLCDKKGQSIVYSIENNHGTLWLSACDGGPTYIWPSNTIVAFRV